MSGINTARAPWVDDRFCNWAECYVDKNYPVGSMFLFNTEVDEGHGLAEARLFVDERADRVCPFVGLVCEPRIGPDDPRIAALAERLTRHGIGMVNTREGRSPEHTRLIYFIRSNKQAWPFASVMFGRLDILEFTRCLAPVWLQEEAETGGDLLVHDMTLSAFEIELSDACDDLLELFSLT